MEQGIKVLNLYSGIGGNRKLWPENVKVTAVEINPEIAKIYQEFFPNDKVIVDDAHKFLLEHFKEFDFIWSSPPCPSHGISRYWGSKANYKKMKYPSPIYPDMNLYQEILFLKHFFKGKWVVENVISYYEPLIKPQQYRSHYYWSNFIIYGIKRAYRAFWKTRMYELKEITTFDLSDYKLKSVRKVQVLRNCVEPKSGLHILNCAFKLKQKLLVEHATN